MFFKKWLTRKNRTHIEDKVNDPGKITSYFEEVLIDDTSSKPYVEDALIGREKNTSYREQSVIDKGKNIQRAENTLTDQEKIHYFGDKQAGRKRITLHIVDELTNRRMTCSVPVGYTVDNLKDCLNGRLGESNFLPGLYHYYISYSIKELKKYRCYDEIRKTDLHNGDTLHVIYEAEDVELIRRSGAENLLYAEYEVVVQWKNEESEYDRYTKAGRYSSERIKCFGYYSKRSIEEKLRKNIGESTLQIFTICESSWPEYRTDAKEEKIKYLCQLSKEKKVVLFAEWHIDYAVMYGCPTAGIFKDADKRQSCSVEIVRYE